MKHLYYLGSLLTLIFIYAKTHEPILVAVLMVKNEQEVMVPTLEPLVQAGISACVILDTGSEDQTISRAHEYLSAQNIDFRIFQEPFVDYATSRNRALVLTEESFPDAAFMLMPDAEWYLHNGAELLEFCNKELTNPNTPDCYGIRIVSTGLDFPQSRLIRCGRNAKFLGALHETMPFRTEVPRDIFFELRPGKEGDAKSARRWHRDKDLLLKEYEKNPYAPRTTFYLAQTYACLGEWDQAAHFYKIRTQQMGWAEENFMAFYRLGQALEHCVTSENMHELWPEILDYYLKAYSMRPHRAEPLVAIAQHYLAQGDHALAFLFAQRAVQLPYPDQDRLFIEKELYEYTRYDVLGICSWYINEFEVGEQAVIKALQKHPDLPHLYFNMGLYLKRKGFDPHLFDYYNSKMSS